MSVEGCVEGTRLKLMLHVELSLAMMRTSLVGCVVVSGGLFFTTFRHAFPMIRMGDGKTLCGQFFQRPDFLLNLLTGLVLRLPQVERALQVDPELRRGAETSRQA